MTVALLYMHIHIISEKKKKSEKGKQTPGNQTHIPKDQTYPSRAVRKFHNQLEAEGRFQYT